MDDSSLFGDDNILEYIYLCHTSTGDANSNIQLIAKYFKRGVRKVMKSNNNSNVISHKYNKNSGHPNKANNNVQEITKANDNKHKESDNDDNKYIVFSRPVKNDKH